MCVSAASARVVFDCVVVVVVGAVSGVGSVGPCVGEFFGVECASVVGCAVVWLVVFLVVSAVCDPAAGAVDECVDVVGVVGAVFGVVAVVSGAAASVSVECVFVAVVGAVMSLKLLQICS